ncbi:MAG: NACHT domain-containing protein [Gammaproteobacteria bacterium]|nr:NACHT domain-containing protein [Gammaproteobacteria bacterium]
MLNRSSNVAVFENASIEAESQIYTERELILGENLLQIYPEALSPIVFHGADKFRPTDHQGSSRPNEGSSYSIGYFREISTGALWVGKVPAFPSVENNPEIQACLEIISAGIYAYYGVFVPLLTIGKSLPISPKDEWIAIFEEDEIRHSTHLLSRWLGRFTPYGKSNNPIIMKQKWQREPTNQFSLMIDNRPISERGLGKILAIAQWLNDNDVIGGDTGANIGYEFQTDLNGKLYARTCKIDTGEAFGDFSKGEARQMPSQLRLDRNGLECVSLSQLPDITQQEFLLTLHQIIQTPKAVLKQFFVREGARCLQRQTSYVRDKIGSIDNAVAVLQIRRQKLELLYREGILQAVTRYNREASQKKRTITPSVPKPVYIDRIQDENVRSMAGRALFLHTQIEMQQNLHFYVEGDGISRLNAQDRTSLTQIFDMFLNQSTDRVLLLLGEAGSGKSAAMQQLVYRLWYQYNQQIASSQSAVAWLYRLWQPLPQLPIPLLIELKRFTDVTVNQCVERVLQETYHLTQQQIDHHKQETSFLFILDGYDEIGGRPEVNLYHGNRLAEWRRSKIVISCRNTDKMAEKFELFSPGRTNLGLQIRYLAPFTLAQIQTYIDRQPTVIKDQYHTLLQQQPNLIQFIENPLILVLVIKVLPDLIASNGSQAKALTQTALYSAFIQQWFVKQETRLTLFLGELPAATIQETFQLFAANLAFAMIKNKVTIISEDEASSLHSQQYFTSADEKDAFYARLACPLKLQERKYSFIHQSFLEYFAALYMAQQLSLPPLQNQQEVRDIVNLLKAERHNPGYKIIWIFLAGLVSTPVYAAGAQYVWGVLIDLETDDTPALVTLGVHPQIKKLHKYFQFTREALLTHFNNPELALPPVLDILKNKIAHITAWDNICQIKELMHIWDRDYWDGDYVEVDEASVIARQQYEQQQTQYQHDRGMLGLVDIKALTVLELLSQIPSWILHLDTIKKRLVDWRGHICDEAIDSLSRFGIKDESILNILRELLRYEAVPRGKDTTSKMFASDLENDVRREAAIALGKLGASDETTLRSLRETLRDNKEHVRVFAAQTLGKMRANDEETLNALRELLRETSDHSYCPHAPVRVAAVISELGVQDDAVWEIIRRNRGICGHALQVLGEIGVRDEATLKVIRSFLTDYDERIRERASVALEKINIRYSNARSVVHVPQMDIDRNTSNSTESRLGGDINAIMVCALKDLESADKYVCRRAAKTIKHFTPKFHDIETLRILVKKSDDIRRSDIEVIYPINIALLRIPPRAYAVLPELKSNITAQRFFVISIWLNSSTVLVDIEKNKIIIDEQQFELPGTIEELGAFAMHLQDFQEELFRLIASPDLSVILRSLTQPPPFTQQLDLYDETLSHSGFSY